MAGTEFRPEIPKTWDDNVGATLQVPLADPAASPKHVFAAYYYKIPVRPTYKLNKYPIYTRLGTSLLVT